MKTVSSFEDLVVWQDARALCKELYTMIIRHEFSRFLRLKDQILGSSGSVADNIAEGFERGGNKEFMQFLYYSKGSCGELRSQVYRAFDYHLISEKELVDLVNKCKTLSSKISNFIKYLRTSEMKGEKYKD